MCVYIVPMDTTLKHFGLYITMFHVMVCYSPIYISKDLPRTELIYKYYGTESRNSSTE